MESDEFVNDDVDIYADGEDETNDNGKTADSDGIEVIDTDNLYGKDTDSQKTEPSKQIEEPDFEEINLDEEEKNEQKEKEQKQPDGTDDTRSNGRPEDDFKQDSDFDRPASKSPDRSGSGSDAEQNDAGNEIDERRDGKTEGYAGNKGTAEQESEQRIKAEYTPGTKEFRQACKQEAEQAVCEEFGVNYYDEFDEEQKLAFMEKFSEKVAERKEIFEGAKKLIVENKENKSRQENFKRYLKSVDEEIYKICGSKEVMNKFEEAVDGASNKFVREMQQELLKGKPDKLLNFARQVAKKTSENSQRQRQSERQKPLLASDLFL